jgi:hypothetical protein
MKKLVRSAVLGTAAVGAIGLFACDAKSPPATAGSAPVEPQAILPSETLVDLVRDALTHVMGDPDPYSRARRLGTLLPTLGPDALPAVKQTLANPMLELRSTETELQVRFWATQQPAEAAEWAKRRSPGDYRSAAVYAAVWTWAQTDPEAAAKVVWPWASDLDTEGVVPVALVRGWYARNDPRGLRKFMAGLPPGIPRQRALRAYFRIVIQTQGTQVAMRWAESLPEDSSEQSFKQDAFRRLIDVVSQFDIEAAAEFCRIHCNGPYGKNMRGIIGRNWALRDAPAALAWLSTALPGNDRNLAVRLTYGLYAWNDPAAAMRWMEAKTTGQPEPWIAPAYPIYARLLAENAPVEAIRWLERIEDVEDREQALVGVLRVWRSHDPAAAQAWLDQSPLSEKAREKVRRLVRQPLEPAG